MSIESKASLHYLNDALNKFINLLNKFISLASILNILTIEKMMDTIMSQIWAKNNIIMEMISQYRRNRKDKEGQEWLIIIMDLDKEDKITKIGFLLSEMAIDIDKKYII